MEMRTRMMMVMVAGGEIRSMWTGGMKVHWTRCSVDKTMGGGGGGKVSRPSGRCRL